MTDQRSTRAIQNSVSRIGEKVKNLKGLPPRILKKVLVAAEVEIMDLTEELDLLLNRTGEIKKFYQIENQIATVESQINEGLRFI